MRGLLMRVRKLFPNYQSFLAFAAARALVALVCVLVADIPLHAASPWENAVTVLQNAFTGPIARGLGLVAIVLGGLAYAYGEGDSKRIVAGILFGVGMAISAVS